MERRIWLANAHKIRLVLHVAASVNLGYALYYDYMYVELPALAVELRLEPPMGGKFKYLTFLTGLLQTGYYMLALGQDLCHLRTLRQLRDYLLASFVVPLALTVSVTFWTLCAINRESIYPPFLDEVYPKWLNRTMHCYVVIYALLELCTTAHRYPKRGKGYAGLAAVMGCYLIWMHLVHYWTGIWIYPFLDALFGPLRLCFFALIVGLSFVYYRLGEHINCVLWANGR
ncbi:androgen-induced gene 1 protein [Drosophila novamexicana]|uniref:androgen-induced gene 1 protein n=1 Tax=Drosophila novamexicana TaxID=47314 RepID=UPI0011E5F4C1|nr:androgen-induced gene 1 protein [Drosophila novamexicana]